MVTSTQAPKTLVEQFALGLDAGLAKMADDAERLKRLRALYSDWSEQYRRFGSSTEARDPKFGAPTAFDYLLALGEIQKRIDVHAGKVAA